MNAQALNALQGLKAWHDQAASAPAPVVSAVSVPSTVAPKRQTNKELLAVIRDDASTKAQRDRAAEQLRRQIKSLCAATLARQARTMLANELEDLTQEVVIRLLQSPASTEPTGAYITRIATNLLIDRQRHLIRRGQDKQALSLDDTEDGETRDVVDPEIRVEDGVLARIQQRAIREALLTLLKPNEAIVVLRRAEGASHDEIAEELGTNAACVRKQAERGLKRLKEHADAGRFAFA
ncbi:RNA polymerase sigma factor [Armatimonas sp.]|uniref:RNA polymerase sigma factor n=1 Tax=Armatimonas sp. TaxID=1872638 RepID=UPI002869F55C|nr:RNA polymerase sigma factor [Armatimonas sp.]